MGMSRAKKIKESSQSTTRTIDVISEPNDWQCIAIIVLLALIFFREVLLGNAFWWQDFLYYTYPVRNFAAASMVRGEIPFWNPFTFSGMPFLADIGTTVFYIPCIALNLFVEDGHLSYYWLELWGIAHYILAGVSMYYLAKSFDVRRVPALFAAVAFMLTGYMAVHAIHQSTMSLASWIPLIVLLFRRVLAERKWKWVFLAALVIGHSILTGFPQLSLYIYLFLLALFLFEIFSQHRKDIFSREPLRMAFRAASCVGLSVALVAFQLLLTTELAELSHRTKITYEYSADGSLAWSQLITLIFPKFFGVSSAQGYEYFGPGPYYYFWETCIYLGVLPLLLMCFSILFWKRNKYIGFLWGFAAFGIMYALGNNFFLHKRFFDYAPGFSTFRFPARITIFLALAAALLSSFVIQYLFYETPTKRESLLMKRILAVLVGMGLLLWLLVQSGMLEGSFPFLKDQHALSVIAKPLTVSLLLLIVSGVLVYTMITRGAKLRWIGAAIVAVLFLDLSIFGDSHNNSKVNPAEYYGKAENIVKFLKQEGTSEYFRTNTRNAQGMIMDRNQGMMDRISTTEGFVPLMLKRGIVQVGTPEQSFDLLNVKYKTVLDQRGDGLTLAKNDTYLPRAFFLYEIYVAHSEDEMLAYLKSPAFNHRSTAVLEKDPGVVFQHDTTAPQWKAHIRDYKNNSIALDVETDRDGVLVLSEMYYPGWKAYVDGAETAVFSVDYNLRGMIVPRGSHHVEVRFKPEFLALGGMISVGTLLVCGIGLAASTMKSRKQSEGQTQ